MYKDVAQYIQGIERAPKTIFDQWTTIVSCLVANCCQSKHKKIWWMISTGLLSLYSKRSSSFDRGQYTTQANLRDKDPGWRWSFYADKVGVSNKKGQSFRNEPHWIAENHMVYHRYIGQRKTSCRGLKYGAISSHEEKEQKFIDDVSREENVKQII